MLQLHIYILNIFYFLFIADILCQLLGQWSSTELSLYPPSGVSANTAFQSPEYLQNKLHIILFNVFQKNGSNHEVTIVLFSRTFYKAKTLEEFPQHMKECLQKDYRGRFYEDFYR